MIHKIKRFFELAWMRLRGPRFKHGKVVPYYGGAVQITRTSWDYRWGWCYKFSIEGNCEFSEKLVQFYLDNPGRDRRSYDPRHSR